MNDVAVGMGGEVVSSSGYVVDVFFVIFSLRGESFFPPSPSGCRRPGLPLFYPAKKVCLARNWYKVPGKKYNSNLKILSWRKIYYGATYLANWRFLHSHKREIVEKFCPVYL